MPKNPLEHGHVAEMRMKEMENVQQANWYTFALKLRI